MRLRRSIWGLPWRISDAGCADAYFNLAHLYEQEGMRANAIRYLKTYRTLAKKS